VHLAVLDGTDVVYLAKVHGRDHANPPSYIGSRMPATVTAVGKAMLAHAHAHAHAHASAEQLDAVLATPLQRRTPHSIVGPELLVDELALTRVRGYATDLEESKLGVSCVAALSCRVANRSRRCRSA